jgi:hypothetical protein
MSRRVIEVERTIRHVSIPVPRLRVGRVEDYGIGLDKLHYARKIWRKMPD